MNQAELRTYLKEIEQAYRMGNATEHTYRSNLKKLLETLAPNVTATNEPKHVKCGAPDFIITQKQTPLGYIETKDIGVSLDHTERTDQMKRYLDSLANLILTDYIEFRWYVTGQYRMTARLAKVGTKGKWLPETDGIEQVSKLLQGFMITQTPTISNPKELATRMASIAQLIRNAISLAFKSEYGGGSLHVQMESFRQVLLPDLTNEQFADMYAQTICYGLFAARCNTKSITTFTREHAAYDIPKTNPFLRKMFGYIAGPDLDERIVWAVDDLAELLNRADMEAILWNFGKRTRQEDPVVHFYETFLAAYDPKMREARGVYYTPEPVVSYIVHSVDHLLKKDFGLDDGLADATILKTFSSDGKFSMESHKVQILDPATGTGTFLHSVVDFIYESFQHNKGMWSSYVSQHLLPRLFGFELLMAPYAVAHMKLGLQLGETGYDFRSNERLGVYLTNTLEEGFEGGKLPFAEWLVEEATAAGNVKFDDPVMVVLGNPPYSNYGMMNKSDWILDLLKDYKRNLNEKKLNLDDDFIKFIRFGQWRINRTGYGILAFITNNTYIDGITHRRMRQSLMDDFSNIYILNLHGSSLKGEKSPDGSKDENVFDIRQGVAISIFVKKPGPIQQATVYHAELWGLRESKYIYLAERDVTTTKWTTLEPKAPHYFFVPKEFGGLAKYESLPCVNEIFPLHSAGIQTKRDKLVYHFTEEELRETLEDIRQLSIPELVQKHDLPPDGRDWTVKAAKMDVLDHAGTITQVAYHPFDLRWTYYTGRTKGLMAYPRYPMMGHAIQSNYLLLCIRNARRGNIDNFFVANTIVDKDSVSSFDNVTFFPLYLYPDTNKKGLFDTDETFNAPGGRRPNLSPAFITVISSKLAMQFTSDGKGDLQHTFGPEDIFNFIYAVFHSSTYRTRYAEFLKIDFPRLPLTSNADLFRTLCVLGDKLVGLHLMKKSGEYMPKYPEPGNNIVEKVEYTQLADKPEQNRIWINKTQYFESIPSEVWEFHIGGYQVCYKWLKDRKGRMLTFDDIKHYQRIVAALQDTIYLMEEIDKTIEMRGGWPIE